HSAALRAFLLRSERRFLQNLGMPASALRLRGRSLHADPNLLRSCRRLNEHSARALRRWASRWNRARGHGRQRRGFMHVGRIGPSLDLGIGGTIGYGAYPRVRGHSLSWRPFLAQRFGRRACWPALQRTIAVLCAIAFLTVTFVHSLDQHHLD